MRTWTVVALLAAGCANVDLEGTCPAERVVEGAEEVEYVELFRGYFDREEWGQEYGNGVHVLTSAEETAAFETATQVSLAEVDASTHQVAVLSVVESSTCGMSYGESGVWQLEGQSAPHAELIVLDSTGTCDTQCQMEEAYAAVLAVEYAGTEPMTACTRKKNRCR